MSDRLVKRLHQHIINTSESAGESSWPRECGWWDFLRADRPETNDPVEMAIAAVWYLAGGDDGEWKKPLLCLQATIAYLRAELTILPTKRQAAELKELVQSPPNRARLEAWFYHVYASG